MKTYRQFIAEKYSLEKNPDFPHDPKIGWWGDGDHLIMYHGTHDSRVEHIKKHGLKAPEHGPTKGWVSLTHDPHTAHGYASMSGGESSFRAAGGKAQHVPHNERTVIVHKIPRKWAEENMNPHLQGNINQVADNMSNKEKYKKHNSEGKPDHEYYRTTELRFKKAVPSEFIVGTIKKYK